MYSSSREQKYITPANSAPLRLRVQNHKANNPTAISSVYYKIVYLHKNHYDYVKHC